VAPGTNGAELVDALKPDNAARLDTGRLLSGDFQQTGSNEFIMYKPRWGAFYQTGLQAFLAGRGITTLVFTGCNFPNCPRASIYEASERDFRIALVKDAVSMLDPQGEKEMEDIGVEIFTTAQLHAFIT
jgi:nicotinamidase-related amidase